MLWYKTCKITQISIYIPTAPMLSLGAEYALCLGGFGFEPRANHIDFKNGTSYSFIWHSDLENRARNQNLSAWCQYNTAGWNIMSCLWHNISARQHSNSEPGAPCHIHTSLQYDWNITVSALNLNKKAKPTCTGSVLSPNSFLTSKMPDGNKIRWNFYYPKPGIKNYLSITCNSGSWSCPL